MAIHAPDELPPVDPDLLPTKAVIAIDGPAGSGKSTTARAIAERFDLLYIDTGAMYRALTRAAFRSETALDDEEALARLLAEADLELVPGRGEVAVLWNGKDVSKDIRSPEIDHAVSAVSSHAAVRTIMVQRQQAMGRRGGVVMEGRDIGSVVFPLATAKIYLSATLEARTDRRYRQYTQQGREISREEIAEDLALRDKLDSERETSPLTISPDAFVIESSNLNLDQQNETCARACLVNPALDQDLDTDLEQARKELPTIYRFAYAIFRQLAVFYGLRQIGLNGQALPRGVLLASNHVGNWDPPLLGSTFHRFPVHTLAKAELFKIWPLGRIFRGVHSIPIQRKGYDANAFAEAGRVLEMGRNLFIFPEGTRRAIGHPGPVRNGLGILVQETRAPVLPVFIRGSYGRRPGGSELSPLEVRYGPIIRWHGLGDLLKTLDPKEVSRRIAHLAEAVYRELQAVSFAETPQTAFEKELGERQLRAFARRQKRVFGS